MTVKEKMQQREAACTIQTAADKNRLRLHLMPKVGWLNDPNGLCCFKGKYHVFYQYAPLDARGGLKAWGHYVTQDFCRWKREEISLFPDQPFDKDGVYSGSACVFGEEMYLFYTGNVEKAGDYDYIEKGREANTVLVNSRDGIHFSKKELLMTNADYPSDYTCHVRDPKVFASENTSIWCRAAEKRIIQEPFFCFLRKT